MLEYDFPSQNELYRRTKYSLDFGAAEAVDLTLSNLGFPIVDGTPITDPSTWIAFMLSRKIHLFQGVPGTLDAFLKPLLSLDQVITLAKTGMLPLDGDTRLRFYRSQVKLESHFDSIGRPQKVNRIINLAVFQPKAMGSSMLYYPALFHDAYRAFGIPVSDMISYASISRFYLLSNCYPAFWDLGQWTQDHPENQEILDFFKEAAPAPIQETAYAGLTEAVNRLDFRKQHLYIIREMPLLRPRYTWVDRTPGYDKDDLHGAHIISVYIRPGRHKFSPILQRFGKPTTSIPVEGNIEGAKVTQQTIEDLLWSGYNLEDITFHKSIRLRLREGRTILYPFKEAMDSLLDAEDQIDPYFKPKTLHKVAGGNFLATYETYDLEDKFHHIALPTYNPIYYSYIRGKAWSQVYRLTSILDGALNRNPDEVYTTDKQFPTLLDGHPISLKGQEGPLVQFDPYFKSTVGIGPELLNFSKDHPENPSIKVIRNHIIGLREVAETGNLLSLGRRIELSATLTPGVGHRRLTEKIPNIGSLGHQRFLGKNITPDMAEKVEKGVRQYAHQVSKLLEE